MTILPAISLWQPYASFIAIGVKPYETRHWRPPDKYVGERIGIHAAKRSVGKLDREWWHRVAGADALLPTGAIVCTAVLREVLWSQDVAWDEYGNYAAGRFCWHMTDVEALPQPLPYRGRQGFFEWVQP